VLGSVQAVCPLKGSSVVCSIGKDHETVGNSSPMQHGPWVIVPINGGGCEASHGPFVVTFGSKEIGTLPIANVIEKAFPLTTTGVAKHCSLWSSGSRRVDLIDESSRFHFFTRHPHVPRRATSSTIHGGVCQPYFVIQHKTLYIKCQCADSTISGLQFGMDACMKPPGSLGRVSGKVAPASGLP
jgi:hypothetical protein